LLAAALITGDAMPAAIASLDSQPYSPVRFR
jgi:hypothetical protein